MTAPPSAATGRPRRALLDWLFFLAAVAAVAAIWLPFASSVVAAVVIGGLEFGYLVVPSLLALPIAAGHAWRLWRRGAPAGAAWIARACSGAAVAVTALFYLETFRRGEWPDPGQPRDWTTLALPLAVLAVWAALMVRWRPGQRGPGGSSEGSDLDRALVLMELAWLANAVLCVVGFYGDLEIGGVVTIAAAVLLAAHAFTVVRGAASGK
jgi:hypothetical protein